MHLSVGDLRSGVGSPGALVMNRSELPMWVLETNLGHLGKKKKKSLLQPPFKHSLWPPTIAFSM